MRWILSTVSMFIMLLGTVAASQADSTNRDIISSNVPSHQQRSANSTANVAMEKPGEPENKKPAKGPFRIVHRLDRMITMIEGTASTEGPTMPMNLWWWVFLSKPIEDGGVAIFDAMATLYRIDCSHNLLQRARIASYLADRVVEIIDESEAPKTSSTATDRALMRAACNPTAVSPTQVITDFSAARSAAAAHFERGTKKTVEKTTVGLPEVKSDRKRLPIRLTDSGYVQSTSFLWMTEGPPPQQKPNHPVEIWGWSFWGRPLVVAGKTMMDATATLYRVDCTKETSEDLIVEVYADGNLKSTRKSKEADAPKRALHHILNSACDPSYKADAPIFPDHQAARAEAVKILAARKQEMASRRKENAPASVTPSRDATGTAGEAERIDSPLRMIAINRKMRSFFMVANAAPSSRSTKPVEIWVWEFTQKARKMDGKPSYDTWATRMRVDCSAGTIRAQLREGYRDNVFDNSWELMGKIRKPGSGSLDSMVIQAACDPTYKVNAQRFRDYKAARTASLNTKLNAQGK